MALPLTAAGAHAGSVNGLVITLAMGDGPIHAGIPVALELHVRCKGEGACTLEFPSAQRYDFEIEDAQGTLRWRWSEGMMFAQITGRVVLDATRRELRYRAVLERGLPPGQYRARGILPTSPRRLTAVAHFTVAEAQPGGRPFQPGRFTPGNYDPAPLSVLSAEKLQDLVGGGPPRDPEREREIIERIVRAGDGVAVHREGGRGRTGTVLGCVLRELGRDEREGRQGVDEVTPHAHEWLELFPLFLRGSTRAGQVHVDLAAECGRPSPNPGATGRVDAFRHRREGAAHRVGGRVSLVGSTLEL